MTKAASLNANSAKPQESAQCIFIINYLYVYFYLNDNCYDFVSHDQNESHNRRAIDVVNLCIFI